ncbi:MAG TPA: hypothetical protein VGD05_06255 [Pyrinomonadaceae bacterium]|jgi:hypothetical protein
MKAYNAKQLQTATAQVTAAKLLEGETTGARWIAAIEKGVKEIKENPTVDFSGDVLRFVSRESGKQRLVTKFGCHQSCECGNQISYHQAIFAVLTRYLQIESEAMKAKLQSSRVQSNSLNSFNNAPYFSGGVRAEQKVKLIGNIRV